MDAGLFIEKSPVETQQTIFKKNAHKLLSHSHFLPDQKSWFLIAQNEKRIANKSNTRVGF